MKPTYGWPTAALAALLIMPAGAQRASDVSGVVTERGTPLAFEVDGSAVSCAPDRTVIAVNDGQSKHGQQGCSQLALGEPVRVEGVKDRFGVLAADRIERRTFHASEVKGDAIVERVLPVPANARAAVQADGYTLLIPADAVLHYAAGMTNSAGAITEDCWISYTGDLRGDGIVYLHSADIRPNLVEKREVKLRNSQEFDAAAVNDQDEQGSVSRFFKGQDVKRFPAYQDAVLQERVDRIGSTLVPAYQRLMPADSPTHLNVRFQIVKPAIAPLGLASGIVLVSYQDLKELSTDGEIAAVLATGLADALDKNALLWAKLQTKKAYADAASAAASLFTFGTASVATRLTEYGHDKTVRRRALQHDLRESLQWMHNAGYDLAAAPKAWWRIRAEGKPLAEVKMPEESVYLYELLSTVWQDSAGMPRKDAQSH